MNEKKDKKILVLSVSSWNSKVGSDTWPTLLEQYNPKNIASISLREEPPDSTACGRYFVISENRIIKSLFHRNIQTGRTVARADSETEPSVDLIKHNERYRKISKKRSHYKLLIRELIWKFGKWKSKELDSYLDSFQPDVILYFMDGYIHFNRICRYTIKRTGAKAVGFFVDDNFTYQQSQGLGFKVFRFFQKWSLKKLTKQTNTFWAITNMTKEEADKTFQIDCTVITKPLRQAPVYQQTPISHPIKILYSGNLQIGRDQTLLKIVTALNKVNKEKTIFVLDVYTKTQLSEKVKTSLQCDFCIIHAPVPQSRIFEIQKQADILLFIEDLDGINARTARLSFSTKITDYLSCAKCIFASGCPETAPMKYFIDNQSALVATSVAEMIDRFRTIADHPEIIDLYAQNACECGIRNHNKAVILSAVDQSIKNLFR